MVLWVRVVRLSGFISIYCFFHGTVHQQQGFCFIIFKSEFFNNHTSTTVYELPVAELHVDRGTRMIIEELGLEYDKAKALLLMHGSVKKAIDAYKAG